jgi:hypothetical protein
MERNFEENKGGQEDPVHPPAMFPELVSSADLKSKHSAFYDIPGHPELIARKCFTPDDLNQLIQMDIADLPDYFEYSTEEREKIARKMRIERLISNATEFKKIGESAGLKITETHYAIGENPETKEPEIFAVSDRIEGENLENISSFSEEMQNDIDEMYVGVLKHWINSHSSGGMFWSDYKNSQIVYGHKFGETEEHPYIVDIDPIMAHWFTEEEFTQKWEKEQALEDNETVFWYKVYGIFLYMKELEKKTPTGKFQKAREVIENLIKKTVNLRSKQAQEAQCALAKEMQE